MAKNVVELKGVYKSIHDHVILHDINLDVCEGEFLTLLGPSGCGKTTLLRLISGFEEPTQGTIRIDGKDVSGLPPHQRHIHTVFQSYALFPHMTVFENIAFGLRCQKVPPQEIKERVTNVLKMVKLEKFAQRKPSQLSGGQQQRVAIARAAVNRPRVLLLDEPLSSLDYRLRKTMQIELKQLQRTLGITFIFVTHDQEEALSMSDRVVVMQEGYIEQIGTPRQVYEEPSTLNVATFIGESNLFEGEIIKIGDNKQITVNILNKQREAKSSRPYVPGEKVYVLIRPEDVRVWNQHEVNDTADMFAGTVMEVIYKGTTVDLIVRLTNNQTIAATEFFDEDDDRLEYKIGEPVWVSWTPGWEVVLPHEA
ncbi:MAG: spermidine/putrescine ABC transporter ATP-binding protein PotA [Gammaproteobacteria bacterium]|nr:spermidine/putrescine ABC transporter ATP-binding protein PotA [Gammaproteobacteria bacterium]MCW5583308.1 spermidine/putrescine ABC transporter ATP-binding protein PotA [Gammaproteobacteria bacterium]